MMGRERNEETGKFITQYRRENFLDALEEGDFLATSDVAEVVGCTRNLAYRRLKELENEGKVKSKEIGRFLAWQKVD